MVPTKLRECLEALSESEADVVWDWLDGNPRAIEEMIDVIVKSTRGILEHSDIWPCEHCAQLDPHYLDKRPSEE